MGASSRDRRSPAGSRRYLAVYGVALIAAALGACASEPGDPGTEAVPPPHARHTDTLGIPTFNPGYLLRDGAPLLLAGPGGPEDFLYHGARLADGTRAGGDQLAIISTLAASGGNTLYVQAVKSHGGDGTFANGAYPACTPETSCYWKINPFRSGKPANSADPRILAQWYTWLSQADAAGIVTNFFLYDDSACPWFGAATGGRLANRAACRKETSLIPEEDTRLITPVVNRLKGLKNLVWVVAEEFSEAVTPKRAAAIAARIRALDPNHVIAVHQLSGTSFRFAGNPDIRAFYLQLDPELNTPELLHASVASAVDQARSTYAVVLAESAWQKELVAAGDRTTLRRSNWAAAMAGAAGVLDYGMWEPTVPDTATLGDLRRLESFFEGTDWTTMSDADANGLEATRYARAAASGNFLLYSDSCAPGAVLGYSNVLAESDPSVTWFDPVDGTSTTETGHLTAGTNFFTAPADMAGECALWVH